MGFGPVTHLYTFLPSVGLDYLDNLHTEVTKLTGGSLCSAHHCAHAECPEYEATCP